jgi:hypothetical protein
MSLTPSMQKYYDGLFLNEHDAKKTGSVLLIHFPNVLVHEIMTFLHDKRKCVVSQCMYAFYCSFNLSRELCEFHLTEHIRRQKENIRRREHVRRLQ